MGSFFSQENAPSDPEPNNPQTPAIIRAPGLGGKGLPPQNPLVRVVRGYGPRGGGEPEELKYNRSIDVRGEAPAVIRSYKEGPDQQTCMLTNTRIEGTREVDINHQKWAPKKVLSAQ